MLGLLGEPTLSPTARVGKDGLTYRWIPPGRFRMGCSPGDKECYLDESRAHEVEITKGFWIGETEVTQEAYQRITGQNPSHFKGAKRPVEQVSWTEAKSYCTAIGLRLPTEAEWEYAARAGDKRARYGEVDKIAWYVGNSNSSTHDVGGKLPNAWGLYDMLGNVYEWTADWFQDSYEGAAAINPKGPATGKYKPLRGGSWGDNPRGARVSNRSGGEPAFLSSGVGFRCVGE